MTTEVIGLEPAEALELVERWHDDGIDKLTLTYDGAAPGNTLKLNGEEIEITEELSKGIRLGLTIALGAFGNLPFGLDEEEEPEEEEENEQPA